MDLRSVYCGIIKFFAEHFSLRLMISAAMGKQKVCPLLGKTRNPRIDLSLSILSHMPKAVKGDDSVKFLFGGKLEKISMNKFRMA